MSNAAIMTPISAKVRKDEKENFLEVCESIGTSPSNAIRMFISAFNKRGGFPFDPANPYGYNPETLKAMNDAAEGKNLSGPFSSVEEMFESLEED